MNELKAFFLAHRQRGLRALDALPWIVGVLLLLCVMNAAIEWLNTRRLTQTYLQLTGNPSESGSGSSQRETMVKRMTENRMIIRPMQLTGVLGDDAIFDGGVTVKAGDMAGDMKVLAVGPNSVKVSKDGKEQTLWVFQPPPSAMPMFPGGARRTGMASPHP